jgi:hypothetical protein
VGSLTIGCTFFLSFLVGVLSDKIGTVFNKETHSTQRKLIIAIHRENINYKRMKKKSK